MAVRVISQSIVGANFFVRFADKFDRTAHTGNIMKNVPHCRAIAIDLRQPRDAKKIRACETVKMLKLYKESET